MAVVRSGSGFAVEIDSGPVVATNKLRDVPQDKWRILMDERCSYMKIQLGYDCRCLVEFVNDAKEMHSVLGFDSPEAMIRDGYELEPEEIGIAVRWLELNPPRNPVPLDVAVRLGNREIGIDGGKPGPGRGHKTGVIGVRLSKAPHSRAYILARLDRDGHAELAARVRSKEMSANAAAIEVGWRKKPKLVCPNCGHEFTK